MTCPFCDPDSPLVHASPLVIAFRDRHPVAEGHTLVLPRRHVETYFDVTAAERDALWAAVDEVKRALDAELRPDGYNIGINAGAAAGQTVMHVHIHVIPRRHGDTDEPSGGVRGVIPSRQKYEAFADPTGDPFGDIVDFLPGEESHLLPQLKAAMARADRMELLSAFVQPSGLELLEDTLLDALNRGACARVLTGDYLAITHPHALQRLYALSTRHDDFAVRFFAAEGKAFHAKAYVFHKGAHGIAFVGSSNLSRSALTDAVEWNLRTTSSRERETFDRIVARFDQLWAAPASRLLTADVVNAYQQSVRAPATPEPTAPPPRPHEIQEEVLGLLEDSRDEGARRGLVVMATGLGKTYLAAFDFARLGGKRLLFLAHREEILEQASESFGRVLPDRTRGFVTGEKKDRDADLLFASVQTLSRAANLLEFDRRHFDMIVVDEFHHAAAPTYQVVLHHFEPRFLLGLTATPDRMDGAPLLALCDENLVARVGLVEGITRKRLVPFRYFGVKDEVDYEHIPWRSGRFDEAELTRQVATRARAEQSLREYRRHAPEGPRRTLAFCVSTAHADFMAAYLNEQGIPAASVHSGATSAPRTGSLERLRAGELEVLCAVDIFNEGLDVPDVNTVLMLRPTESPVIFLQQLGRGLRLGAQTAKSFLTVVDFIGNHRSFLRKPQALLALTGRDVPPGAALRLIRQGQLALPPGCSVEIETAALDMLEAVSHISKDDRLIYEYVTLRDTHGFRPRAADLFDTGVTFQPVRDRYDNWHAFVKSQGDLGEDEARVLERYEAWFGDLLRTGMTRSYKMVALEVLLGREAIAGSMAVGEIARLAYQRLAGDPLLRTDLVAEDGSVRSLAEFEPGWRVHPLQVFHRADGFSRSWFALEGDTFRSKLDVPPELLPTFAAMTAEVIELRLREYKARRRFTEKILPFAAPIAMRVSHSSGNPILRFDRNRRPDIPSGDVPVEVEGEVLTFSFQKIAVNVARSSAGGVNKLPTALRQLFGPSAGLPGTRHEVALEKVGERYRLRRLAPTAEAGDVVPLRVPFYENLKVACGRAMSGDVDRYDSKTYLAVESEVELDARRHFLVRASGESMNGGLKPIRDGDLVLCEWAEAAHPDEVEGKPCLLSGYRFGDEVFAQIKIPVREEKGWVLRSTNPAVADEPVDPDVVLRVAGRVIEVVSEAPGLTLWGSYTREVIAQQFGSEYGRSWQTGHVDVEVGGAAHTILLVTLHKGNQMGDEYRYADRFLTPETFQWESQNQTSPSDKKGRVIVEHRKQGRTIHLFARFHGKVEGKGEAFVYCGPLEHVRHQGAKPMTVDFRLESPLPRELWRAWME